MDVRKLEGRKFVLESEIMTISFNKFIFIFQCLSFGNELYRIDSFEFRVLN